MFSELKLVDSLNIKYTITSKFPCSQSEHFTSIVTDRGTIIYRLLPIKENSLQSVTFAKYFIDTSDYSLSANLGILIEPMIQSLKKENLYECMLRTETAVSLANCIKKTTKYVSCKWSPMGLVGRYSVLVVLNDTGSLDVYARVTEYSGRNVFKQVVNVTNESIKVYKSKWSDVSNFSADKKFEELKMRLDLHMTTAFTWTHLFENNGEKFAFLIVSYANGRINFWIFKHVDPEHINDLECKFMYEHRNTYDKVSYLHWIQSANGGLLIIAYERGKMIALPIIDVTQESFEVSPEIVLYPESDIKVEYIDSQIYDDNLFIFAVKLDKLLIYLLNKEGEILDVCNYTVGNLSITGLRPCKNYTIFVSTLTGACKELTLANVENKIQIDWRHVYVNINWTIRRCLGFFPSKNNIIFSFITDASTISDSRKESQSCHLSNFVNRKVDYFKVILENPTVNLQEYADYFEAIRMLGIVDKYLNCEDISVKVDFTKLNLSQLKTYFYLIRICEPVVESFESTYFQLRPSCEVQTMIEIKLAVYSIQYILDEYKKTKKMTDFMKLTLNTLENYLKEIVVQDLILKYELGNDYTEEVYDVLLKTKELDLHNNVECSICGNDIFGVTCINRHYDNRCVLTMIPVTKAQYKCFICERYMSIEAMDFFKTEFCPYCDYPLETLSGAHVISSENHCKEDCLIDNNVSL